MRKIMILFLVSLLSLSVSLNLFQYTNTEITCKKIDKRWKADLLLLLDETAVILVIDIVYIVSLLIEHSVLYHNIINNENIFVEIILFTALLKIVL